MLAKMIRYSHEMYAMLFIHQATTRQGNYQRGMDFGYHQKTREKEVQTDGRIRKWKFIEEVGKYLRVILLEDGETVHNAFFDRNFKEGEK